MCTRAMVRNSYSPAVRLVVQRRRPRSPTRSSARKSPDRRRPQQALVEEGLHVGQDDLAVDVVLQVLVRLVAGPDGPMPR